MTTIVTCSNVYDAQRFQLALEAAGISSSIPDEEAEDDVSGSAGVHLQVADEDAEEARRIIAEEKWYW